jgi:CO/xanthine dehydrogenase FAD-binding subunit
MKLTERPAVTATALITLTGGAVSTARLVVGSVTSTPYPADTADLHGATPRDFQERAEACAIRAAADCTPLPDTGASPGYLRHLVTVHARQALTQAFSAATAEKACPMTGRPR